MRSQLLAARAAALFASHLPAGSRPSPLVVGTAIAGAVRQYGGTRGCVAQMAAAYGDYPETAAARMRWAREVVETAHRAQHQQRHRELIAA
jgi:sugar (pentulose or hexulose) kinase